MSDPTDGEPGSARLVQEVDVAVVGAGVAALGAALSARSAKARVRIVGGPRGLSHLASGTWDRGHLDDVPQPLRAPLRDVLRASERALLFALGGYRAVPFRSEDRPLVAMAQGTLRRALSAERNVLDLAALPRARVAVVGLPALPLFESRALARALDEDALRRGDARRFFAVELEHGRRSHDILLGSVELARINESPRARARLTVALQRALAELPCDAVLLPPILGGTGDTVTAHLERSIGRPVGEVVTPRSVQSERLTAKLEQALGEIDRERVHSNVSSLAIEDSRIVLRAGRTTVHASAVVLACGRELAGGLVDGRVALLDALAPRGAHTDARSRLTTEGRLISPRVFGAGSMLAGLDPSYAVGLSAVGASGWLAGLEAARAARG